ncbi:MAG: GMC oxidoreductase [Gemmatimonadales bacterium]
MTQEHWDAVVIGTGFGGSTVALRLAQAGHRVLVLERGRWVDRDDSAWDPISILVDRKYKSRTAHEVDERRGRKLMHPDDAVGGKSVFYGAASFRLREADFRSRSTIQVPREDPAQPVDWPISYSALEQFYTEAEHEIGVAGVAGVDPTEPPRDAGYTTAPPPYGSVSRRLADAATKLGLKPFPMPLAINYTDNSDRPKCAMCMTCDLFPCKICAKNDLSVTLLPRAKQHGAIIRDNVKVKRLVWSGKRVSAVECHDVVNGGDYTISCDLCVVSCGAIASAKLLLNSGLGNLEPNGRLIGHYLMRHCSGVAIAFFPFKTNPERQFHKQFAITDYYFGRPDKQPVGPWGIIQALQTPPPEFMLASREYPRIVGWVGAKTVSHHAYLICMAEDLPNYENRVEIESKRNDAFGMPMALVHHRYCKRDLQARNNLFRAAGRILRKAGALLHGHMPIHTYSHAIGTARFGHDPADSVLDPWCRLFGMHNVYVVDGGFLPSSGGVNPSLTIAAMGFRVGRHLADNWRDIVGTGSA